MSASEAGPSTAAPKKGAKVTPALPAKIAKNTRLPATMITPSGSVQASLKNKAHKGQISKKKKARIEKGKERAVELSGKLETKVKEREEKKAKRQRAKKAWE
ncbi:hypothetical protein CI109_102910 [Kwoniella shandongensis]|uniref:Uncharacterized protein n=1 Tax=Kwoniella shandongensis TaxID=1734106 RepID=A0A5M6C7Y6_9TREE|nr:uncharacterized protein CI109_000098 [Kwoniella shandongensis]KAA5531258.1 hypothetical protein CI109_000098 [Kwoniella shandongensis]